MRGIVLSGMKPDSLPNYAKALMPTAWVRETPMGNGSARRVLTCTMGCGEDFLEEDLRRLAVNGCFWTLRMEDKIADKTDVHIIGDYKPSPVGGIPREG